MGDRKVGIVIPAYNVEDYLAECLESVLAQSYKNIIIAVANDGSTDGTWDIISRYKTSNPLIIRAINSENRGVMQERDACIDLLDDCDYITFVDGDDALLDTDIIRKCITEFEENSADMVCFNFTHGTRPGYKISDKLLYDKKQTLRAMLIQEYLDGNMWGAVYRYNYVQELFQPLECNNDDYVNKASFIKACKKIVVLPDIGYFYRINQQSQTHRKVREMDYVYYEHVCLFCRELLGEYPELNKECEHFEAWVLLWLVSGLSKNKECAKMSIYLSVMKEFKSKSLIYLLNPYFSIKEKLTFVLVRLGLFRIMYHMYHKIIR